MFPYKVHVYYTSISELINLYPYSQDPTAKIGSGCRIGPSVVIGPDVTIEDGTTCTCTCTCIHVCTYV